MHDSFVRVYEERKAIRRHQSPKSVMHGPLLSMFQIQEPILFPDDYVFPESVVPKKARNSGVVQRPFEAERLIGT